MYEANTKKSSRAASPYLCEVVKWPKEHPPAAYQEIYVSDRYDAEFSNFSTNKIAFVICEFK